MKLIIFAALTALCSAAKLDNTYLPPASAKTAGGSEGLQTPIVISDELPVGSFVNDAQGVVVDAVAADTRTASGFEETGLGGSRTSYGSTVSKVGEAAFTDQIPNTFARIAPIPEHESVVGPVYGDKVFQSKTLLPQDSKDYNSNTLSYENNVESHKYNYGFQSDNGIAVGENGVAKDGIHAQGGYSYKGNDGQNHKVTYTADKGGYQPQGSHLPTPHPIPDDIVKSIEQNAKGEAAGHYDDGSYDAQKHNVEGDYADTNKYDDKQGQFEKRPESQPNGVIINQNSQTGSVFGFGSGSTAKPQTFNDYKPGFESTHTGQSQIFSSGSTGVQGAFGSSSFGQNTQGLQSGAHSKPQFGQTSFGSQYTTNQFGSQLHQGSKPSLVSQPINTQFGFSQESAQGSGIISNTPTTQTFTQFGSQTEQKKISGSSAPSSTFSTTSNKPGFPSQGTLFGKPVTSSFGSSITNFGQAGTSNAANAEYLSPESNAKPHGAEYQKPQFGFSNTPIFDSGVSAFGIDIPTIGSTVSPQKSSATATATVTGPQTSLSGLSPQVLGGFKRPSATGQFTGEGQSSSKPALSSVQQTALTNTQETQEGIFSSGGSYNQGTASGSTLFGSQPSKNKSSAPQSGTKPGILTTLSIPSSTFTSQTQGFGSVKDTKQPQYTGFQINTQKPTFEQQSQGFDQGYKYNQPGKPFGTPSTKPQGTSFTGVSSGQYNSASSTNQGAAGSYQPSYSGVTQAAASPFPSPSPTPVSTFPQKPFSQSSSTIFGQKPSSESEQTQFGQGSSVSSVDSHKTTVVSQNAPSVPSQQYTGELYQYNKPEPVAQTVTPSSTPSSLDVLGKPTQSSFSQGSLTSSQFGQSSLSGNKPFAKPQFGFNQGSQTGSQYEIQKTQQVSTQFGAKPQGFQTTPTQFGYKPFGTQFGAQGSKPQFGQTTQTQGSTFTQTQNTQQTLGSVTNTQQLGQTQPQKPFGGSPFGFSSTKPQFGHGSQVSEGSSLLQSNQQTTGSVTNAQKQTTQFGVKPQGFQTTQSQFGYKPFGSQFGAQGTKPQLSQSSETQDSSFTQTQSTQQTVGSVTNTDQSGQTQPEKPFGVSQFGVSETKPQFGQVFQGYEAGSLLQSNQQTIGSVTNTQTQTTQGGQVQTGYLPPADFSSTSGVQETKPQFGQGTQTSQGSGFQVSTQNSQQTVGTATQGQTSQSQFGVKPQKPFGTVPQFGSQGSKPQFGQATQNTQGSSFQQSTQTTQQTVGSASQGQASQSPFGVQPQKPFGTVPQFGSQGSKPQFGQDTQTSQGSSFQQSSQTTQETVGSATQGQTSQSQLGIQPQKPFGTVPQFGSKPQFGQTAQTTFGSTFQQSTQQTFGSATQGQTSQSKFGSPTYKPVGSTFQFGAQGNKPQFGQVPQKSQVSYFQQTPVTSQTGSVSNGQQQSSQGSFTQSGTQTSKPFGTQFGQQTKPQFGQVPQTIQGSSFTQSQTTQQTIDSSTQNQPAFGSQSQFGTPSYKPFGSQSQFGTQGSKPQYGKVPQTSQGSSATQTQTTQQTVGSVIQQTSQPQTGYLPPKLINPTIQIGIQAIKPILGQTSSSQGSTIEQASQSTQQTVGSTTSTQNKVSSGGQGLLGSQPLIPISITTQLGVPGTKPQSSSSSQTQTVEQSESTLTQQQSGQDSSTFGSQSSKPFGSTPQFGITETKPQFGQVSQTSQGSSLTQTQQGVGSTQQHQGSHFGSQNYKPFGNIQSSTQGSKPQFGQVTQTTQQNTFSQSQFTQQSLYNKANQPKPFISSSPAPFTTAFGTQPAKTQFGSTSQNTQGSSTTSTGSSTSQFGLSSFQGSAQLGSQSAKPFSTSHQQETKPQFGAPSKPLLGQSPTTPFSNTQHSQTQFGSQYKPFGSSPVSAFGKYQPKPQFGQTGFTGFPGFGTAQASSSASTSQQPFRGTSFGSQPFRPFGSSLTQPLKSQFGQPSSFASAFASSSSGPLELVPGTKFTVQPYGTPSTVLPTAQPEFGKPTTSIFGQEVSGTHSTSLTSIQGSDISVPQPFSSGLSPVSTVQPLGSKPNFGFSKPCCQSTFGQSTTQATPSYGVSSTTPSLLQSSSSQSPHDLLALQGGGQKTNDFKGPKQPQRFDQKTGYYY